MTQTEAFGKRVREVRTAMGVSQEVFADHCGLTPAHIGQIERGEKSPTIETVCKIASGAAITLPELFSYDVGVELDRNYDRATAILISKMRQCTDEQKRQILDIVHAIKK